MHHHTDQAARQLVNWSADQLRSTGPRLAGLIVPYGTIGPIVPYGTIGLAGFSPLGEKESAQMGRLNLPKWADWIYPNGQIESTQMGRLDLPKYRKSIEKAYEKHTESI